MELDDRDGLSSRSAWDADVVFNSRTFVARRARDVESAGDRSESGNLLGKVGVACELVGESPTVGLACGVNTAGIDAISILDVIDHILGETDVIDIVCCGVALPLCLVMISLVREAFDKGMNTCPSLFSVP